MSTVNMQQTPTYVNIKENSANTLKILEVIFYLVQKSGFNVQNMYNID